MSKPVSEETATTLSSSARWALASLSLSMLMPSLDTSIANTNLPALARAFGASFQAAQWIVLAYLLAITALIVSVGRLGDLIGRRRLLLAGIALFTGASLLCGAAPTFWLLLAARAVQGLGAAVMMALTVAIVGETVPKARVGSVMGLLGTLSAVGTAFGPTLGGFLTSGFGWRSIFLVNLPLGLLNFLLARRYLPVDRVAAPPNRSRFDGMGTLLLGATLVAYALAMTSGHGRIDRAGLGLLLAAGVGAGLFVLAETRAASPLLRPALLRTPRLGAGLAANALVATVMMTTLVVGPFYLARGLGLDASHAGLVMSVGPAISVLSGVIAGRLVDRFGPAPIVVTGLVQMLLGALALCRLPAMFGVVGYLASIAVLTPGYQLFQAANNTAVMTGVRSEERGVVSGMLSLARNLGLITGASAMGAVFAWASAAPDVATATPMAALAGLRGSFGVAAGLIGLALLMTAASLRSAAKLAASAVTL